MDLTRISKKINWYYYGKIITVCGLGIGTVAMLLGLVGVGYSGKEWCGIIGIIGYVLMLVFIIIAAIYPIGKYSIRKGLEKKDIGLLLDYIINYKDSDDKFYDALQVIFCTVSEMIHDNGIMNWSTAKGVEDVQNKAWNYLFNYLNVTKIFRINPQITREFASELKSQIENDKIIDEELEEIAEKRFEQTNINKQKRCKGLSLRWNVIVAGTCLVALFLLVVLKCILYYNPELINNMVIQLINQLGADVVAFVLAILTLKAEITSK